MGLWSSSPIYIETTGWMLTAAGMPYVLLLGPLGECVGGLGVLGRCCSLVGNDMMLVGTLVRSSGKEEEIGSGDRAN